MSLLEQAAEILFAGDVPCAGFAGEAGQGFVFHFEAFQPHDADIFRALFPDLTLTQFHAETIRAGSLEHHFSLSVLARRPRSYDGILPRPILGPSRKPKEANPAICQPAQRAAFNLFCLDLPLFAATPTRPFWPICRLFRDEAQLATVCN